MIKTFCDRCGKPIDFIDAGSPTFGPKDKSYGYTVIIFYDKNIQPDRRLLCADCRRQLWEVIYNKTVFKTPITYKSTYWKQETKEEDAQ